MNTERFENMTGEELEVEIKRLYSARHDPLFSALMKEHYLKEYRTALDVKLARRGITRKAKENEMVEFNEAGQVVFSTHMQIGSSEMGWTTYDYDVDGKLMFRNNNNNKWTQYTYCENGYLILEEFWDGRWTRYENNEKGKCVYIESSNGRWTRMELTKRGRIIFQEWSTGQTKGTPSSITQLAESFLEENQIENVKIKNMKLIHPEVTVKINKENPTWSLVLLQMHLENI